MATVSQVTEAVYRARYEDQVTAAANAASKALRENTAAVVTNEQAVTRAGKSATQLAAQYDPVTRATRNLERAQRDLANAQSSFAGGVATTRVGTEQAERAIATLQGRVVRAEADVVAAKRAFGGMDEASQKLGNSSRITAQQMSQLTPQLNDIFTSIAGGMPAMMILTQQGPQITQIFGGVRATMAAVAATVGTTTIAVGALSLAFVGLVAISESAAKRLDTIGDRLRATRTDYLRMAQAVDAASQNGTGTSLGRTERTEVARILATPRQFAGNSEDLVMLTRTAEDLAVVLGTTAAEAAQKFAKAMRDPASIANELNENQFPGMERSLVKQIEGLQRAGDRAGAFARVLEVVQRQTKDAAAPATELGLAWQRFGDQIERAWNGMKRAADALGSLLTPAITAALNLMTNFLKIVEDLDRFASNGPLGKLLGMGGGGDTAVPDGLSPGAVRNVRGERSGLNANSADAANDNIRALQQQADLMRFAAGAARELAQAEAALKEATRVDGGASASQVAAARSAVQSRLNGELTDYLVTLGQQAEAEQVAADATSGGTIAMQAAANQNRALTEALKYGTAGSREYEIAVGRITAALDNLTVAEQARRESSALRDQRDQLEILEAEGRLVGATADQRERELAALKERQRIVNEGGDIDSQASRQRVENAQRATELEARNAQLRTSVEELARVGEQAFDRIGSAITEAFTQGSAKAINFGSIAKAVLSEIVQYALRMSVLNPALNAVFGGTRATAGTTATAMSFGGFGGGTGGIGDLLGLSSLMPNGISGVMGQTLWGTGSQIAGPLSAANPLGAVYSGSTTSLGSLLGGAGLGFGAGSLLNGLVGGKSLGGSVGSGLGGLGGAALGSIIPGVGTLIGGLLGGGAGGLLGGMFGSNPQRPASSVQIGIGPDGQLTIVGDRSKGMSSAEGIASTQQTLAALNARVAGSGLSLRASNGAVAQTLQGSDANPARDAAEMTRVVLGSLQGGSESVGMIIARELAKGTAASLDQAFSDIDFARVYDQMIKSGPALSELETAVNGLNKSYGDAIARARDLGLATDVLAQRQQEAVAAAIAARDEQYANTRQGLAVRLMAAQGNQDGADLLAFDLQANQQRAALTAELNAQGATGEAYVTQLQRLEDTLWTERRNISERGARELVETERRAAEEALRAREAATGSATSVISSLGDYARSLSVGSDSPLSARDQFNLAQRQFNAVSGSAVAGDANSISQLQGYAQTYLSASRSLYGSTEGYAQSFQRVQDVLGQVGGLSSDTLTGSFLAQQVQSQTETLVGELQALRAAVDDLKREQMQSNSRPRAA